MLLVCRFQKLAAVEYAADVFNRLTECLALCVQTAQQYFEVDEFALDVFLEQFEPFVHIENGFIFNQIAKVNPFLLVLAF